MKVYITKSDGAIEEITPSKLLCDNVVYVKDDYVEEEGSETRDLGPYLQIINSMSNDNTPSYKEMGGYSSYGMILRIGAMHYTTNDGDNSENNNPGCELFLPWYGSSYKYTSSLTLPIYYRSITDVVGNPNTGWSPWRRIAYYDEIENIVVGILKEKGLIT